MNKFIKMGLIGALAVVPAVSFAATAFTGKWVDKTDSDVSMNISGKIAVVHADCGARYGSSKFKAHVITSGNTLTLNGPIVPALMAKKPHTWQPFAVHFVMKNGQLIEVKPYPAGALDGVGYWHGASCGYNFADVQPAPDPIYPAVFVKAK
jgi:hypothetical protein